MHALLEAISLLPLAATSEYCSSGTLGHLHHADVPTSSAVMATVCCPAECDRCGGVDCWSQAAGLLCCARHVYDRGLRCVDRSDTGCVLPKPTGMLVPSQQRERSCLDMWSAAFPDERQVHRHAGAAHGVAEPHHARACARAGLE